MKRIMIIDALNQFLRAYIVNPSLSTNGDPIGGTAGFLKILQKLCREINPDRVVICWDGKGGSARRKSVNKNYKEGRKPLRLNRDIKNLTEEEELQNKIWQQIRLVEYLNNFPVTQLVSDGSEADDVISFVAQLPDFKDWQKVIISSDKDFFQLLDDKTIAYRPTQKEVLNKNNIIEKFGIHPTNFALARAIVGDKSDNLDGVPGIGLPTVAKRLSFLAEEKTYSINEVIKFCANANSTLKAYQNIVESEPIIKENYQLMQLYAPSISVQSKTKIKSIIREAQLTFNKTSTNGMMLKDGIGKTNWNDLYTSFRKIVVGNK
jgi:5'-3' exonuclease